MTDELRPISLTINGRATSLSVNPTRRLLDVLREDLGLTGSKEGCGEGECGACVVLVDGRTVNSCILAVGAVEGSEIETIEGVRESASGAAIVESFAEHGAVQCGFCIPGMIVSAEYLLRTTGRLSDAEIREGIAGNLCRCTGYDRIVEAISQAAGARER